MKILKTILLCGLFAFFAINATAQTTNFTVTNTAEWTNALEQIRNGGDNRNYVITIVGNVYVPGTNRGIGSSFGYVQNIVVTLNGNGIIQLNSNGSILVVGGGDSDEIQILQTLIIDDENLILRGHDNNSMLLDILRQGMLQLKNGEISGNTNHWGSHSIGAVSNNGTFTMTGGRITRNNSGISGISVENTGTFTMVGGKISENIGDGVVNQGIFIMYGGSVTSNTGTGVSNGIMESAIFTMHGGKISRNEGTRTGVGGVLNIGTFTMYGGKISENVGIGVDVDFTHVVYSGVYYIGTFTMIGGKIRDNVVGVNVWMGTFTMTGGEISNNSVFGVHMRQGTTVLLGGTAIINNNAIDGIQRNLALAVETNYVILSTDNPPTLGMNVGVTKFSAGWHNIFVESGAIPEHVQFFFSDDPDMCVFHNSPQGELELRAGIEAENPNITSQPQGQFYAHNIPATPLFVEAEVSDGGVLTYQWFSNTTNNITGGTPIIGATNTSFTPPTTALGTMYYFVMITNEIPDNGDGCQKTRTIVSNIVAITVGLFDIDVSANPSTSGTVSGGGTSIAYGTSVTVQASANVGYSFTNWTESGTVVSTNSSYTFTATNSRTLVANFILQVFSITYVLNGGTNHVDNPATFTIETPTITLQNPTRTGYFFAGWAEGNTIPQGSTGNRTFTAQWMPPIFNITVSANPPTAGFATGGGTNIAHGTSVTVSATVNECWQFVSWTINGEVVSTQNPFTFSATETANLVANFDGPILDFDTYASTLWNNTFMLNLNRLRADGFEALDARWFKNGIEIIDTRTGSVFSYSAGPNASDLLETAPTFYHFEVLTERCGVVASTPKTIASHNAFIVETHNCASLQAFPNPIQSGGTITLENTTAGHKIQIFNRSGMLVKSAVATDGTTLLTLNIPQGIYIIHVENQTVQILVTE